MGPQALAHGLCSRTEPILLSGQHLEELSTSGHDGAQRLGLLIRQGPRDRPHDFGEVGQDLGIQPIGLGEDAARLRKIPHLPGIHHDYWHSGCRQCTRERDFEAPVASKTTTVGCICRRRSTVVAMPFSSLAAANRPSGRTAMSNCALETSTPTNTAMFVMPPPLWPVLA